MENNTEMRVFEDDFILDRPGVRAFLCVAYTMVFLLCCFGNLSVVIVLSLHWRMRSVTKFCMGNLAFANLCVAVFCIYQNLSTFLQLNWIFGEFLCKMYYFINSLSHTASILILVVISVERYLSIVYPLKGRRLLTIQRLRLTIAGVWLLSGLISAPRLYYMTILVIPFPTENTSNTHEADYGSDGKEIVICAPTPTLYNSATAEIIYFGLLFLAPLVVMSMLYAKIGSVIRQSSLLLRTIRSTQVNKPAIPLTVRIIGETPRVPQNSLVDESSICSSASSRSYNSASSNGNNYGRKRSAMGGSSNLLAPVGPDVDSTTCYAAELSVGNEDEGTEVSVFEACEILYRQDCDNTAAAVTALQDQRRGHHRVCRSRESAIRMLIIIVVTFAVCHFPYHLRRICQYYVSGYDISSSFNQLFTPVTFLLMYANCAVNPILYAFLSKRFRSSFKDLFKFRLKRSYYRGDDGRRRSRHHRAGTPGYV